MTGGIIPTPKKRPREVLPPSDLVLASQAGRADGLERMAAEKGQIG